MSSRFSFEMASKTPSSKAVDFVGVFDDGKKITFITKTGIGYTYSNNKPIDKDTLEWRLSDSIGKFWVTTIKPNWVLVDKDEDARNWEITSDTWLDFDRNPQPTTSSITFTGLGLYSF